MNLPPINKRDLVRARRGAVMHLLQHFQALRVSREDRLLAAAATKLPLVVYTNYPGRWNMLFAGILSQVIPERSSRAPLNAEVLRCFPHLRGAGMFPVDGANARGGVQFVRTAIEVLAEGSMLWMSPEGRIVDPRCRPLLFKPGIAAVTTRIPGGCLVLPCAIEYTFWEGRMPEALGLYGEPALIDQGATREAAEERLKRALEATMDELSELSKRRDEGAFRVIASGTTGLGKIPGAARRVLAKLHGMG